MRKLSILLALVAGLFATQANADVTGKDASAATITWFDFICFTTKHCPAHVNINSAGTEVGTSGAPFRFDPTGTTTQPVSIASLPLPTGAATSALQSSAAAAKGEGATGAAVPSGAQYGGMNIGGNLTGFAGISAGADGVSNTANQLLQGAFNYFYNGTTWDRVRGTTSGGMLVNVSNTLAAVGNNADGVAAAAGAASPVAAYNYIWNGATWDRQTASGSVLDPCQNTAKTTVGFTLATAAVKVAITGVSAKKIYVCAWDINNNAADGVALFEATTGTTCATAAAALVGNGTSVATAAQGYNFAANGGIARGNGTNQVLATLTNAADLCVAQTAATQLTGSFTYVTK